MKYTIMLPYLKRKGLGIKRLAVVRLDVDDLGAAFMAGFSQPKEMGNIVLYHAQPLSLEA